MREVVDVQDNLFFRKLLIVWLDKTLILQDFESALKLTLVPVVVTIWRKILKCFFFD